MKNLINKFSGDYVLVIAIIIILAESAYIYKQYTDLKIAKEAYNNPQIKEVIREVKVTGPVRIEYRTIKEKGEKEIVEKIIYRESEAMVKETEREEKPVFAGVSRSNRYLLGFSNRNFSFRESDNYTYWGGYSFGNRLDVLGGVSRTDTHIQCIARF